MPTVTLVNPDGQLFDVEAGEEQAAVQGNPGLSRATPEQVSAYDAAKARREQYGTTGQQALGTAETVVRTATMGLVPGLEGNEQRSAELHEQSPFIQMGAQALGTVAPALAGGGAASALGGAVGIGGRGLALAAAAGEGTASGLADELEAARFEKRKVSASNVLMWGLGGELIGRAVPALARRGVRGALERLGPEAGAAVREATGLAASAEDSLLATSERRARASAADVVSDLPAGPARDRILVDSEKEIVDTTAQRTATALDQIRSDVSDLSDVGKKPGRIDRLLPGEAPIHKQWAGETRNVVLDLRDRIKGVSAEGLPVEGPDLSAVKGVAGKVQRTLTDYSEELGAAKNPLEMFVATDSAKRALQGYRRTLSLGATKVADRTAHDALGGMVEEAAQRLRSELERPDLWGKAADLQEGVNAALHSKYLRGTMVTESDLARRAGKSDYHTGQTPMRYDAGKVRNFLRADRVGRGLTPENLDNVLTGAEDMLAAHKRHGTADPALLKRLERNVAQVRNDIKIADDVQAAKASLGESERITKAEAKAQAADAAKNDMMQDVALGAASMAAGVMGGGMAGAAVMGAGKLLRYRRLLNTLADASDGAVTSAARGAVRGMQAPARQAMRAVDTALGVVPKAAVPAFATALSRFQGEYPSPHAAYEARRDAIEQANGSPVLLARALATGLGDLPEVDPVLYGDISSKLMAHSQYIMQNLPPQIAVSMAQPRGIPLSRQALRDMAILWNSTLEPHTVFADVRTGMASPKQIKILRETSPDLYDQLKRETMRELGENFEQLPTQRKLKFDILFDMDGAAGLAYSSVMGKASKRWRDRQAKPAGQRGGINAPSAPPASKSLTSIGAGVTTTG